MGNGPILLYSVNCCSREITFIYLTPSALFPLHHSNKGKLQGQGKVEGKNIKMNNKETTYYKILKRGQDPPSALPLSHYLTCSLPHSKVCFNKGAAWPFRAYIGNKAEPCSATPKPFFNCPVQPSTQPSSNTTGTLH